MRVELKRLIDDVIKQQDSGTLAGMNSAIKALKKYMAQEEGTE